MKERGILYTPENVQKIFRGLKWQTRRIVKIKPPLSREPYYATGKVLTDLPRQPGAFMEFRYRAQDEPGFTGSPASFLIPCTYGQPGDLLWIKEPHYLFGDVEHCTEHGKRRWKFHRKDDRCFYLDGPAPPGPISINIYWQWKDRWFKRSPLFMARRDARLITELTSVRVERLQEISKDGCDAEGIEYHDGMGIGHSGYRHSSSHGYVYPTAQEAYRALWESIHGQGSWDRNDWVWVLTFQRKV